MLLSSLKEQDSVLVKYTFSISPMVSVMECVSDRLACAARKVLDEYRHAVRYSLQGEMLRHSLLNQVQALAQQISERLPNRETTIDSFGQYNA